MAEVSLTKKTIDIYTSSYRHLETVMRYLEQSCFDCMDQQMPIYYLGKQRFIECYYEVSKKAIKKIQEQHFEPQLEKAISEPLDKIIHNNLGYFTYQQRSFYKEFISGLDRLLNTLETIDHDKIIRLLVSMDYNHPDFTNALEEKTIIELNTYSQLEEKKRHLYFRMSQIKGTSTITSSKYMEDPPAIKDHLYRFVKESLKFIEREEELQEPFNKQTNTTTNNKTETLTPTQIVKKRKVNLSIHEIALFARLFTESEVVSLSDGKQKYFRFLSEIYQTNAGEDISENAIKNAFYSPKKVSFDRVEQLLIQMLGKLQKLKDA